MRAGAPLATVARSLAGTLQPAATPSSRRAHRLSIQGILALTLAAARLIWSPSARR
jgi:hypothetical protein